MLLLFMKVILMWKLYQIETLLIQLLMFSHIFFGGGANGSIKYGPEGDNTYFNDNLYFYLGCRK